MTFMSPFPPYFGALVSLVAGILILVQPKLLNYIVAVYLIIIGILGLIHPMGLMHP